MLYSVEEKLHSLYVVFCSGETPLSVCCILQRRNSTLCMLYSVAEKLHSLYVVFCSGETPLSLCCILQRRNSTLCMFYSAAEKLHSLYVVFFSRETNNYYYTMWSPNMLYCIFIRHGTLFLFNIIYFHFTEYIHRVFIFSLNSVGDIEANPL